VGNQGNVGRRHDSAALATTGEICHAKNRYDGSSGSVVNLTVFFVRLPVTSTMDEFAVEDRLRLWPLPINLANMDIFLALPALPPTFTLPRLEAESGVVTRV